MLSHRSRQGNQTEVNRHDLCIYIYKDYDWETNSK